MKLGHVRMRAAAVEGDPKTSLGQKTIERAIRMAGIVRRKNWGQEGKMAVLVLMQTSKSHAFPLIKLTSCPRRSIPKPQELPVVPACPHRVSLGKRGSRVTRQPGRPQLFQETVSPRSVLCIGDHGRAVCSPRLCPLRSRGRVTNRRCHRTPGGARAAGGRLW